MKKLPFLLLWCFFIANNLKSQQIWTSSYGVPGYNTGVATRPAADGGYMVFGNRTGISGNGDIFCVRIDSMGNRLYDKIIDFGNLIVATGVCTMEKQGYGIIGYSYVSAEKGYDMLLIRTDTAGNVLWSKTYGGNDWDMAYSVINLPDSGFLFCGETYTNTAGHNDAVIVRTNSVGDTLWTKTFGGSGSDVFSAIDSAGQNEFFVAGTSNSFGTSNLGVWIMKCNLSGDTLWTKHYGSTDQNQRVYSASVSLDKGLFIVGVAADTTLNSISHHLILRVNKDGAYMWHEIPVWLPKNDEIRSVHQRADSTIVYAGYTENSGGGGKDMLVNYLNNDHTERYGTTIGGLATETSNDVIFTLDGGCVVSGTTNGFGLYVSDALVVKLDSALAKNTNVMHLTAIHDQVTKGEKELLLFPNPAGSFVNVQLNEAVTQTVNYKIFSLQGVALVSKTLNISNGKGVVYLSDILSGAYLISMVISDKEVVNQLFIKL